MKMLFFFFETKDVDARARRGAASIMRNIREHKKRVGSEMKQCARPQPETAENAAPRRQHDAHMIEGFFLVQLFYQFNIQRGGMISRCSFSTSNLSTNFAAACSTTISGDSAPVTSTS